MIPSIGSDSRFHPDFAIVSNIRCGSTWLATALARTGAHVNVDWEVKLEAYSRSSVHFPIGIWEVTERLSALTEDLRHPGRRASTVLGTKITLDVSVEPFHAVSVNDRMVALERIRSAAPAMRFVHLTRGLCDQSQSPGGHSTEGLDQEGAKRFADESRLLGNVMESRLDREADQPHIHQCEHQKMFHQLINDVCVALILSGDPKYLLVRYESLHTDFAAVLKFLDLPTGKSLAELSATAKNRRSQASTICSLGNAITELRDFLLGAIATSALDERSREILVQEAVQLFESERVMVAEAARATDQITVRNLLHELGRRLAWKLGMR